MNFFKKLRFWKRKRNDAVTTRDIGTTTDNFNSETGTQVSSTEIIVNCHVDTQVDSILTCEASTQTSNVEERPMNRTDGVAAEKEKMRSKVAAMEKLLEEKDRLIRKQYVTIDEMKERQRSHIQFIKTQGEREKSSLQRKVRDMREEIISLKERRPPKEKGAELSAEQESHGPGWSHVVRGGRVVKATSQSHQNHATGPVTENSTLNEVTGTSRTAKSQPKVTIDPKQATVFEDHQEKKRWGHMNRREAVGGSNSQLSGNKRHRPNLPPRLQNRK